MPATGNRSEIGIIADPIPLLHNFTGVLIGMVHVLLPYMVLPIYGAVRKVDPAIPAAAAGLGASNWRIFWRVWMPLTLNGVFAGCVLVFVLSLGFYITPAILGGGKTLMVAEWIGLQILDLIRWGLGTMMATVLVVAILATLAIFSRVVDLRRVFGSGA